MAYSDRPSDAVHWYMNDVGSRIVAKTGVASDRHHLGKLVLQGLKEDPSFILQIDGGTGESETCGSVLNRSVQCARALQKLGFIRGDVITIMSPSNIHVCIPMYAAFYLGVAVACVDFGYGDREIRDLITFQKPRAIFCQSDKAPEVQKVLEALQVDCKIITFGKAEGLMSLSELLKECDTEEPVEEFKASDFDPDNTLMLLISTSGSTSTPKSVATTHKNLAMGLPYLWYTHLEFPNPTRLTLALSPLQWYSAIFQFVLSPVLRHTRLHTSSPTTPDHIFYLINKYRPTFTMTAPIVLSLLVNNSDKCDITCFEKIYSSGSAIHMKLFDDVKKLSPKTQLFNVYGQSELGLGFFFDSSIPASFGKVANQFQHRLVNTETLEDITEPNIPGELWLKGPTVCQGYYNCPKDTAETIVQDGWLRTGDIMYRDQHWYFYYVDRYKMMLKYRSYQISPIELESVIAEHSGVSAVAVSGVPDEIDGDLPVAFVVPREGSTVSAKEIKDLVKDNLVDQKQLRGGVQFLKALPLTPTSKIDRKKLKLMASELKRK